MAEIKPNTDNDFIVVVGHALYSPWIEIFENGQLKTWLNKTPEAVIHAFGNPVNRMIRRIDSQFWKYKWNPIFGKYLLGFQRALNPLLSRIQPKTDESFHPWFKSFTWRIGMPDLDLLMANKTMAIFRNSLSHDYGYLVTTTSSSYINLEELKATIKKLSIEKCVAGRIIEQNNEKFPSGTFRIFSRDVIKEIVKRERSFSYWLPEDLALGRLLKTIDNITWTNLKSVNIPDSTALDNLSDVELKNIVHFRLTSGTLENRNDTNLMRHLHERMKNIK